MNETVEAPAEAAPHAATHLDATHPMSTLVRRELWEHPALWAAPLVVAAALLLSAIFIRNGTPTGLFPSALGGARAPEEIRAFFTMMVVMSFGFSQSTVMAVVLWFYSTSCLYNERRDRSILFWKSMPVSDAQTVLSKMLVAVAVVPLYVYLVTLVTTLAAYGIVSVRAVAGTGPPVLWDGAAWLHTESDSLVWLVLWVLWYAPVTAYLLLISAWARRNVQLWTLLPVFIAIIVERIAFGSHYLSTWLLYRLGPGPQVQWEQWIERLFSGASFYSSGGASASPTWIFPGGNPLTGLANIDLWIGLAVAAGFLFAATRVRRYRDDT